MRILLIEDELAQRQILKLELTKLGNEVVAVGTGTKGLEQLERGDFDVAVTDLKLPDFDGIEVIRRTRESGNDVPILMITAYGSMESAISALQVGATDYLIKPVRVPDLARRLQQIGDLDHLNRENRLLRRLIREEAKSYWFPETPLGKDVRRLITKVGDTDLTVLITGESGTGKGMTARLLHSSSPRADGPFLSVNCGAIPESLIESELFGFTKGAFTGASKSTKGLFAAASGGTLFLDEISNLTPQTQAKMLHAIEEKSIRPIGSAADRPVDLRIIAATNRDLEEMVKEGGFREDLMFRLNVFRMSLPPLREQREAVPSAVEFFLAKHAGPPAGGGITLSPEAWDRLTAYDWPGNLREMENAIEMGIVLCEGGVIRPADLPPALQLPRDTHQATTGGTLKERTETFERLTILQTLERVGGDRQRAAKALGVGLSTLYRKLEEPRRQD
jgi:two-component system response regulator AtoC